MWSSFDCVHLTTSVTEQGASAVAVIGSDFLFASHISILNNNNNIDNKVLSKLHVFMRAVKLFTDLNFSG